MPLAHTLGEGGPEIELLLVAVAMLVLGVIFFLQKSAKPVVSVVLVVGAFAMGTGAFVMGGESNGGDCEATSSSSGDLAVRITEPADGSTVEANEDITLDIELEGATGEAADGHFDVTIDGEPKAMTGESDPQISMPPGEHELQVEYVNSRHEQFDPPVSDTICVEAT